MEHALLAREEGREQEMERDKTYTNKRAATTREKQAESQVTIPGEQGFSGVCARIFFGFVLSALLLAKACSMPPIP